MRKKVIETYNMLDGYKLLNFFIVIDTTSVLSFPQFPYYYILIFHIPQIYTRCLKFSTFLLKHLDKLSHLGRSVVYRIARRFLTRASGIIEIRIFKAIYTNYAQECFFKSYKHSIK